MFVYLVASSLAVHHGVKVQIAKRIGTRGYRSGPTDRALGQPVLAARSAYRADLAHQDGHL
jgi:hypothetical protein